MTTTAGMRPEGGTATRTRRWRPQRSTVLIVAGALLAVAVVVIFGAGPRTTDPLDPDNPGPDGAQAVARVLADQGVEVTVARGAAELDQVDAGADTTVLVVSPDLLSEGGLAELRGRFAGAALVVAGAGPGATAALGLDTLPAQVRLNQARDAGCADPLLEDLEVLVDTAYAYPADGCFDGRSGTLVVRDADLTLLGADQTLSNDQVLRADNAGLALRLLGQRDRLVWYVPSLADLTGDDGVSLRTLLPEWIQPGLWILALSTIGVVLWRGRRLGSLAAEPLPVVVRAIETTHSLGRLYRRSGDRAHAARTLREAARRRAGRRLQLGRGAEPADVIRAVARHLDRREDDVAALLAPDAPPPTTDPGLITLAADLAELDREVRRP